MTSSTSEHGVELLPGLNLKHNAKNQFAVLRLHYSADPDKNPETERGRQWFNNVRQGKAENQWLREYEIDFLSHVGKRVCPDFRTKIHVRDGLQPHPDQPMRRGWDPGIVASACVVGQIVEYEHGLPQVRILHEYPFFETAFYNLVKRVVADCERMYPKRQFWDDQDVAGRGRDFSGRTAVQILGQFGISPRDMKSKPDERAQLINHLLISYTDKGEPCLLVHPRCHRIIAGARGLYRFKETRDGRSSDRIDKTEVVHLFDSMGYMIYNNLYLKFKHPAKRKEKKRESFYIREVLNAGKEKARSWLNC